jgi:hypothetical protein
MCYAGKGKCMHQSSVWIMQPSTTVANYAMDKFSAGVFLVNW